MRFSLFFKQIFSLSIVLLAFSFIWAHFLDSGSVRWLYLVSISAFLLFCVLIFFYAYNTTASDQLFSFNNIVIGSFVVKLAMSVAILMAFERFFSVSGNLHVWHYLFIYLVYTVYEIYFLTKLAKVEKTD